MVKIWAVTLQRIDIKWVIIAISVAIVAYLALMPLAFLLWQSFSSPTLPPKLASSPSRTIVPVPS